MADAHDDHHGHDVHFESADAGASLTYPQQAGTIRKNGFLVIKNRPCKVGDFASIAVSCLILPPVLDLHPLLWVAGSNARCLISIGLLNSSLQQVAIASVPLRAGRFTARPQH